MTQHFSTIELFKEYFSFNSGHYTIFSPTEREPLHGHRFHVYAAITAEVDEKLGMPFDYGIYKKKLKAICVDLGQIFLIAGNSPYQRLEDKEPYLHVHFNNDVIPFLKKDIKILPITNVTVEELSRYFVQELIKDTKDLEKHKICKILVKVYSSPGQSGSFQWENLK